MSEPVDKYADIRPYNDDEVAASVARLIDDNAFIDVVAKYNLPRFLSAVPFLSRTLVKYQLRKKWGAINSVEQVQQIVAKYLAQLVKRTTTEVTFSGLDQLDPKQAYLFISNHRDIVLDPALINWGLFSHKMKTVRIAIGDNLLQIPYITELMRLNKSFIVKRSVKAPKEMLRALSQLSAYIYDSLAGGDSIWIAQKEGRAKDGFDQTDPALLKMLQLNGRKQKKEFAEYVRELKIVPVSISYQYEPCATAKARELYHKQHHGKYVKSAGEDIASIVEGFSTAKGHVHLAFGQPIEDGCESPEQLAKTIDEQIIDSFFLHPGNYIAGGCKQAVINKADAQAFEMRMARVPDELKPLVLAMYAKPFHRKVEFNSSESGQ
ncbi:MAG: 1-acyl-sn-glycerol-3-phosphate acyltransferase [Pseudoalteromonas rhizosphaerae]|jgi:1-acyl-sn-glycerol-3-phosphate acyltransferase|uniref:1-acyl-sn-glycerol-3-phosphate acyltransferase n=1 Tax=Pseudoalteromonas neustonica TaxID=1840331 RepID=A0ABY3FGT8_9GAMM|nr:MULTISPECIES: 1-acyl-sn-glycerol-3-phosphate acyltransferase [Pseudoalteromonas]MBB1293047.1 1-acyl-sn-glycerol-3-phosphate acyltransferase [Pseudoalteromonas sp. SR41-4]MBB1301144.1 1-acyl-sn-glycerol-3-phosphate acyltransferase [Pseudoalteromonas sp. SR44-8]MBB1309669.1 1-acyl-sn-glycerol-3-phosphate acyltransferase [Pseudoalteromonas sp. SR41-8]MBB1397006.1 1-acyl-sn-glycerol-3-phosphate acyltransferase [Pseudoalteromonas sp. SG44-8]MBB1408469.1 1-acyl-sn-glycerol-3-phosphate acyltransfe|tara:strand:- start:5038 stop:6171 length:1134 start_codon:yes stop_codon:yes gene_type:complete